MREAIVLLVVFALMALSAKANGAETPRVEKRSAAPVAVGIAAEVELVSLGRTMRS
jgi:hypothetical protein